MDAAVVDLDRALAALNEALDALDERLAERLADHAHGADAVEAARRQARTARRSAAEASDELALAMSDLDSLLARPPAPPPTE